MVVQQTKELTPKHAIAFEDSSQGSQSGTTSQGEHGKGRRSKFVVDWLTKVYFHLNSCSFHFASSS